jgi:hypothetical protein
MDWCWSEWNQVWESMVGKHIGEGYAANDVQRTIDARKVIYDVGYASQQKHMQSEMEQGRGNMYQEFPRWMEDSLRRAEREVNRDFPPPH